MDVPRPEEDDALIALDPLDVVERVLAGENLAFDRTDEGDVAFSVRGDWREFDLWFAWRPEAECLQLCLSTELKASGPTGGSAHALLNLVNHRVWLGHFELWPEDGEIVFRHALSLPDGERPSLAQTAAMIDAAMEAADRFYPAFDFLISQGRTPEEAMTACMFETLGTA